MISNIKQEDFQTIDSAKARLTTLAVFQGMLWIAFLLVPTILQMDILRSVVVSTIADALPRIDAGGFFFSLVALLAAFAGGSIGFGKRSWTFVVVGFWMVVANLVFFIISGIYALVGGAWHVLKLAFYLVTQGMGEMTTFEFTQVLSSAIVVVLSFLIYKMAQGAIKPAFRGVLILGRAQEMDSGLIDFLAPFEGKNKAQVLAILFRNSLTECVTYALVGHMFVLTLFSAPGFINKLNDAITAARTAEETTEEPAETDANGDAVGGGNVTTEGGNVTTDGTSAGPGKGLNTPAATGTSDDEDDMDAPSDEDSKPTGKQGDYDKHMKKPGEKKDALDDDFLKLD